VDMVRFYDSWLSVLTLCYFAQAKTFDYKPGYLVYRGFSSGHWSRDFSEVACSKVLSSSTRCCHTQ